MDVKDSNRARKRIVAFLLSQGGRVTSGQNDGLVRWIYDKISSADYVHERINDLKQTLIAMEQDGLVALEWAIQKQTRLCAVALAEGANVETVDEEDFDLFDGSRDTFWMLITMLQGKVQKLEQTVRDSERVLDELVAEERLGSPTPPQQQHILVAPCGHEVEIRRLQATFRTREAQLQSVQQSAIDRLKSEYERKLEALRARHERYRSEVNHHKSQCGDQLARLQRELSDVRSIAYQA